MPGYFAPGDTNVDTGGEFPSAADRAELGQDGCPWQGEIAVPDALVEFATSVTVDTAGEFPSAVGKPELGKDGDPWGGEIAVPDAPDEFASSITVGFGPC
jgi:hypothetical protein